jgi:hypothetical protein
MASGESRSATGRWICQDCGRPVARMGGVWYHIGPRSPGHLVLPVPASTDQPDVSRAAIRALAEKIAADIMTSPFGAATRLVLELPGSHGDSVGWARGPLADRIEMLLRGER